MLSDINSNIDAMIRNIKSINGDTRELEDFKSNQDQSQYFKKQLTKEIKVMKNIISEEQYISKMLNEKK